MAACPNGHDSASDNICDTCGAHIAPGAFTSPDRLAGRHRRGADSYSWSAQPVSPPLPPPAAVPPPAAWMAVVTPDRAYYERPQITVDLRGTAPPFPAYLSERRVPLYGAQMRIGRRSPARGLDPEIDLAGPPADPGVSRLHALLIPAPDGTWGVLDPGSANGTTLNGRQIAVGELVPLHDGDRINVGAWTAITVHRG